MEKQGVSGYCGFIGSVVVLFFSVLLLAGWFFCDWVVGISVGGFSDLFVFDVVGFYLSLLTLIIFFVVNLCWGNLSVRSRVMLLFSLVSGELCYFCCHSVFFWLFYEISILSLLYLLISESPYSERFLAGWYFSGYIVLTSLPMLLALIYLSFLGGSYNMLLWVFNSDLGGDGWFVVSCVLVVLFLTKVPVPPFHSWLPIVHAEVTSIVSVCLSGYIMKLGLLGVCRFCFRILSVEVFSDLYVCVCMLFSLLFFVASVMELDGKRWIALLSLSHILIGVVLLSCGDFDVSGMVFFYSLGHGMSAGGVFVFLWWCYDVCGSRNWCVLKNNLGGSFLFRWGFVGVMCSAASLPPLCQFYSEVMALSFSGLVSIALFFLVCVYLFIGNLVPMVLVSFMMSRVGVVKSFGVGGGYELLFGVVIFLFVSVVGFLVF